MRKIFLIFIPLVLSMALSAPAQSPVKWTWSAQKTGDKMYEIHLLANIDAGWHIYSRATPDGGPIPTSIAFTKNPLVEIKGDTKELGKMEKHFEPLFGVEVKQFSGKVDFVQEIKLKGDVKTAVSGSVDFMVCNDRECLPPHTEKFTIAIK